MGSSIIAKPKELLWDIKPDCVKNNNARPAKYHMKAGFRQTAMSVASANNRAFNLLLKRKLSVHQPKIISLD